MFDASFVTHAGKKSLLKFVKDNNKFSQYLRFFFLRGFTFSLNLIFIAFIVEILMINYRLAYLISASVILILNYMLGAKFVFRTSIKSSSPFLYLIITVSIVFLSSFLLKFLKEGLGVHYLISSVISVLVIVSIKFFALDKFVFKNLK